ncbi:uncharacterized protein LOC135375319 isoform X2 [Ornithodoros turicata]|uniref:uncharacterized protein LOC135375319 isoform X2 n=1 Tax=Ornithodoros turicata TaxID=34597 RepID=UPI00313889E1
MLSIIIAVFLVLCNVGTSSPRLTTELPDDACKLRPINVYFVADGFFREVTEYDLQKYAESQMAKFTTWFTLAWMGLACCLRFNVSGVHLMSDAEEDMLLPKATFNDSFTGPHEYVYYPSSPGYLPRGRDFLKSNEGARQADIVVIFTGHRTIGVRAENYLQDTTMCTDSKFVLVQDLPFAHSGRWQMLHNLMDIMGGFARNGHLAEVHLTCRQMQHFYRKVLTGENGHTCHTTNAVASVPSYAPFYKFNPTQFCRALADVGEEFYEGEVIYNKCRILCREKTGKDKEMEAPGGFPSRGYDAFTGGSCIDEDVTVCGREVTTSCSLTYGQLAKHYLVAWGVFDEYPSYIEHICDAQQ